MKSESKNKISSLLEVRIYRRSTVCPRSLDPFYVVTYYLYKMGHYFLDTQYTHNTKSVKTSWTYSKLLYKKGLDLMGIYLVCCKFILMEYWGGMLNTTCAIYRIRFLLVREAAKKVLFLVARPLRGEGGGKQGPGH